VGTHQARRSLGKEVLLENRWSPGKALRACLNLPGNFMPFGAAIGNSFGCTGSGLETLDQPKPAIQECDFDPQEHDKAEGDNPPIEPLTKTFHRNAAKGERSNFFAEILK